MISTEKFAELEVKGNEKSWNTHPTEEGLIAHFEAIKSDYQQIINEETGETHGVLHIPDTKRVVIVPDREPYFFTPHEPHQKIAIPLGHMTAITFIDSISQKEVSLGLTIAPRSDEGNQGDGAELRIIDVWGFQYGYWDISTPDVVPFHQTRDSIQNIGLIETLKKEAKNYAEKDRPHNQVAVMHAPYQTTDSIPNTWERVKNKPQGFSFESIEGNLLMCITDVSIEIETLPDKQVSLQESS